MGTPEFAVPTLEKLVKEGYKPLLCITQPDKAKGRNKKVQPSEVKKIAIKHNIPLIQPENVNSEETVKKIAELSPDLIITVAYGGYLGKKIRNLPKYKSINLHPSLLPLYRGAAPINYALFNGDDITGNTIFKNAVKAMTKAAKEVLNSANWEKEDVDFLIPHQANLRIIRSTQDFLKLTDEQVYINIDSYGNTSSASIPIALDEANRKGLIKEKDKIVLAAFGGGFTWAAAAIQW